MNYPKIIEKVSDFLNKWEKRDHKYFGEISLIKNNILSKFVHLFSFLPNLKCYLNEINHIICLGDKNEKNKRKILGNNYLNGGLKVVNNHV